MIEPTTLYAQLTSAELAFVQSIGDHVYTDGQLIIGNGSTGGVSVATLTAGSGVTITNGHGTISIAVSGSATSFVDNEVVSGSGTSWTLANTPVAGSEHLFGEGQRLTPGGVDYTISGSSVTTVNPLPAGALLADYRK